MNNGKAFYEIMTNSISWTAAVGPWPKWETLTSDLQQRYEKTAQVFIEMGWTPATNHLDEIARISRINDLYEADF